jgi:hypothetical protein
MTLLVAQVAVATSISPVDLLECPPEIFNAMVVVLKEQAREAEKAQRR